MNAISPAAAALFAAPLYFVAVIAARAAQWTPLTAHPLVAVAVLGVYVVIVVVATHRAGVVRTLAALITIVALHAVIVWTTASVWTLATQAPLASTLVDALWRFPAAAILQALCVPIMAWPLRPLFAPRRVVRSAPPIRHAVAPLPKAHPVSWPVAASAPVVDTGTAGAPLAATHDMVRPVDRESSAIERTTGPIATKRTPAVEGPVDHATASDVRAAAGESGAGGPPVPAAAAKLAVDDLLAMAAASDIFEDDDVLEDDDVAMVRIRFEAVASQIPPQVLTVPATEIGPRLSEPGYLLVPEALVVSQLAEGRVCVAWEIIGAQLPDSVFAGTRAEIGGRLSKLAFELPLSDIVAQLSPDVFASSLEPLDLAGIEKFPLPFSPSAETLDPVDPTATTASAEPDQPVDPLAELDDESLLAFAPDVAAAAPVAMDARPPAPDFVVAEPLDIPVENGPVALPAVPYREVRALFERLNRYEIDAEMLEGVVVYRVVGPDMSAETLRALTARLLPSLRRGWSRGGIDQITVRGTTAAVVVTALGDLDATGAVLVTGTRRGPGLALVELLGRRGVAERPGGGSSVPALAAVLDGEPLGQVEGDDLGRIAHVMAAFGAVGGRRFAEAGALVYAFVDPGLVAADVAAFAREVVDAVTSTDMPEVGTLESVTGRRGAEQVVIRAVARPLGVARLVVAAGAVDRPGLAQRQVERAAALLAAEVV